MQRGSHESAWTWSVRASPKSPEEAGAWETQQSIVSRPSVLRTAQSVASQFSPNMPPYQSMPTLVSHLPCPSLSFSSSVTRYPECYPPVCPSYLNSLRNLLRWLHFKTSFLYRLSSLWKEAKLLLLHMTRIRLFGVNASIFSPFFGPYYCPACCLFWLVWI